MIAARGSEGHLLIGVKTGFGLELDLLQYAFWPSLREEHTLKAPGQPVDNLGITNEPSGPEPLQKTVTQATG